MSFLGKVLIGLQVVLSLMFMTLAGAVYTAHTNWKSKYDQAQTDLQKRSTELQNVRDNFEQEKNALTTAFNNENGLRLKAESTLATVQTALAAANKDKNDLQAQIQTQTGIAETKSSEAGYRDEEARKQRVINSDLQARLDGTVQQNRQFEDKVFTLKTDLADLQKRFDDLQAVRMFLEKVVAKAGLDTDPRTVAQLQAPPPAVDGLVKVVHKDRTGRPDLIVITIGSDDGLIKGHELDAFRSGIDGRKPQWLGKLRVVSTAPDEAVCEIVDAQKNGIIEVGDNVTTKLF